MDIESLWSQAYEAAVQGHLAKVVAKGVDLTGLESLPREDPHKFESLIRQEELASLESLGLPVSLKHKSKLDDLFQTIYDLAPAFDVLAQSNFIFTLTWGMCRLLIQVAQAYRTLSAKAKDILCRILSYVDYWKDEALLYEDSFRVKSSIKTLFYDIIVLVGFVRHRSQSHWVKRFRKSPSLPKTIEECAQSLQRSAESLDRALRCAAGQTQKQYQSKTTELLHSLCKSNPAWEHEFHRRDMNMLQVLPSDNFVLGGEQHFDLGTWLTPDHSLEKSWKELKLVPDTCQWLLATSEWLSWCDGSSSKLLTFSGPPGCGKSCIAQSAYQQLTAHRSRPVLSYFFDSSSGSVLNKAEAFLASILVQLYQKSCATTRERILDPIKRYRIHYSTVWQCPFRPLLTLVDQVLQKIPSYALVVDSLDECETSEINKSSVLTFLAEISSNSGAAVLTTCRSTASFTALCLDTMDLRISSEAVHTDIERYVEHRLANRSDLRQQEHLELRRQIFDAVVKGCQDNFLHAKLFLDLLQQQSTPRDIRTIINDFGSAYPMELYEKILTSKDVKLPPNAKGRRNCMLCLLAVSCEPLSTEQINEFLAIDEGTANCEPDDRSLNITEDLEKLCGPFITISRSFRVTFFHTSAKDFFTSRNPTTADEANLYLARKCLAVLSQPVYRSPDKATKLLRQHLLPSDNASGTSTDPDKYSPIYEYAAKYFHEHITAIPRPPTDLIAKLGRFLRGIEFVTWSESVIDLKPGTSYAGQISVFTALSKWANGLPSEDQQEIQIEQYFETAHLLLSLILKDDEKNQILQFLPRIRLGDYFSAAGQSTDAWQKAYEQKKIVVDGLSKLLPEKDPLLLKSRVSLLQEYFWQKRFAELLQQLQDLYKLQKEVLGDKKDDLYVTAWLIGSTQVALTRYHEAKVIISETLEEVRRIYGEEYRFFNVLLLLEAVRLERVGDLDQAALRHRAAIATLTKTIGDENVFVFILKTALGAVLRKQGKYDEAERNLLVGWGGRQPIFSINLNVSVDAALQLAMLYRDKGDGSECLKILESIQKSTVFKDDFERHCQLVHVRSLVALDKGEYIVAKAALTEVLQSASGKNRAKNNRELLWVRIDLADAMRSHGEHDAALLLFTDLVKVAVSTDAAEETEPRSQLKIAERALRFVRFARFAESRQLLEDNGLRWVRDADFWFSFQGGPILDTSIIAPVKTPS